MQIPTGTLDALRDLNSFFCETVIAQRNFAGLDRVYTANAKLLPPGAPMLTGRDAIRGFWQQMLEATGITAVTLHSLELEPAGDTILEIGRADMTSPRGADSGKYVVIWKQEDGQWKWAVDIFTPGA